MAVSVAWENTQRSVLRVNCDAIWEAWDLRRPIEEVKRMLNSVPHKVDIVVDLTFSMVSPRNLLAMLSTIEDAHCENQGLLIIVRADSTIKSLGSMARVMSPKVFSNLYFVDALEDTHRLLRWQADRALA